MLHFLIITASVFPRYEDTTSINDVVDTRYEDTTSIKDVVDTRYQDTTSIKDVVDGLWSHTKLTHTAANVNDLGDTRMSIAIRWGFL